MKTPLKPGLTRKSLFVIFILITMVTISSCANSSTSENSTTEKTNLDSEYSSDTNNSTNTNFEEITPKSNGLSEISIKDFIYDETHNIYSGYTDNQTEVRVMITRQDTALTFAIVTRNDTTETLNGEITGDNSFHVANNNGEYLDGYVYEEDDVVYLIMEGFIFDKNTCFSLYLYTFYDIGTNVDDYYSSNNTIGITSSQAEDFAMQLKTAIGNKEEFAKLISYPITLKLNEDVVISNEEEMLLYCETLKEYNDFENSISNIFTKYMFANYTGVCIDNGLIWFSPDSEGNCKITAING
ncbi:MAG: hypothetical protein LUH07_09980 [Lachnospiraceae bacterium]|nr:hypothetical protein [Lachnospiraceae bacterium]